MTTRDFARLDVRKSSETPATLQLVDPFDEPKFAEVLENRGKPIDIHLLGPESATGRRASARMAKDLEAVGKGKQRRLINMDLSEILEVADTSLEIKAKFYAALTTGWSDNLEYISDDLLDDPSAEPEVLPFTNENAVMLYKTRPWIAEQVDRFLSDRSNYAPQTKED